MSTETTSSHDVIVVGGGHNGLIAALRLARAGCTVTVLEQGSEPGGCVWSETHSSGVLVERGAFEHGGVVAMATELGLTDPVLGDKTLVYREHPVAAGFVFGNGERRTFYTDLERTVAGLGNDAAAYRQLVDLAAVLFDMLDTFDTPPTPTMLASTLSSLQGGDALFRTMLKSAETVINTALDDPCTQAALALQAAHAQVPAWAPGTGMFALLLPASHAGPAVRPSGGSAALIGALVAAAQAEGVTIRTDSTVVRLGTSATEREPDRSAASSIPAPSPASRRTAGNTAARLGQRAKAGVFGGSPGAHTDVPDGAAQFDWTTRGEVELADGSVLSADAVVAAIGLPRTAALLSDDAPALRSAATGLHSGHFNVSELTVTLVFDRRVELGFGDPDAIWYAVNDPADVRRGFGEILAGQLPSAPWAMVAEVGQPDGVSGSAIWMSSTVPLERHDGPWDASREHRAAQRLIDHVASVLGLDLRRGLVDVIVSGPATWSRRVGGDGNPNHIDNTIDQLLGWRPPGHADMRTELDWLFLSGAGQHPGGGLSGAAGSAAAAAVLTPRGAQPRLLGRLRAEAVGLRRGLSAYLTMRKGHQ